MSLFRRVLHWISAFVICTLVLPVHARLKQGEIVENEIDLGFGKITLSAGKWRVIDDWNLNSDRHWNIILLENTSKDAMLPIMDIRYTLQTGKWKETTCDRFKDDKFLYATHNTKPSDFINKCSRGYVFSPTLDDAIRSEKAKFWWGEVSQRLTQSKITIPSEIIVAENEIQKFNAHKVQINFFVRTARLGMTPNQIRNNRISTSSEINKNINDWLHEFVEANTLSLFDNKPQVVGSLASYMASRSITTASGTENIAAGSAKEEPHSILSSIKNGEIYQTTLVLSDKSHLSLPDGIWEVYLPKKSANSSVSNSIALVNTNINAPISAVVYRDWTINSPDPLSFPCKASTDNFLGDSKLNTTIFDYYKRCVSFYELGPNFLKWKSNSNSSGSEWMHILRELPSLSKGDNEKLLLAEIFIQKDGDLLSLFQLLIRPTVFDKFGGNSAELLKNPASSNNFLLPWIEQFALSNQTAIFDGVGTDIPHLAEFSQKFVPPPTVASTAPQDKLLGERALQAELSRQADELKQRQQAEAKAVEENQKRLYAERLAAEETRRKERERLAELSRQADELKQRQQAEAKAAEENQKRLEVERLAAESRAQEESRRKEQTRVSIGGSTRKALIIGNDDYQSVPKLANARSDARAISDTLQSLGFQVYTKLNLNERAMKQALRTFKGDIKAGDEVLFYFAGHGVQVGGSNYLLPTDIRGESEDQVKDEAIQLQRVMDDMQDSKAKFALAVIDACRDNPFKTAGRAIGGRGLAPTSAATGQMIIFSAGNGQQALDKLGKDDRNTNSVFTRAFLKEMQVPGVSIDRVLRNVRKEVVQQARTVGHDQVPALYDQAVGDFYFKP